MGRNKKIIIATLVTGLAANPMGPMANAQDFPPPPDFNDEGDFSPPPPNMPAGDSGGVISGAGGPAAEDSGVLTKKQKDRFNRANIEDINNQNFPETIESFDFPNVEITDVIKTIGELTGKNFIIDPGVRGKITIIAPSKITVAEAYKAFLSALAINGYTVVPSGAFLKVKNARNAQRDSIETYSGAYYPNDDQMITRIIHLKHISAEIVNRELRILPSKDGEMSVYTPTNSIILSDYGSNIDRVMKIMNQLDVPGFEEQIDVVPIKYAKAKDMSELIDKIVNKGQKTGTQPGPAGSFSSGVPRFSRNTSAGASGQSGNAFFMALPDDRTNTIIVVGNRAGIVRVKKLIAQLDFHIRPEDSGGVFVYYVKHGDAEKIAQVLQGVTKEAAPKAGAGANTGPGGFPNFGFPPVGGGAAAAAGGAEIFGGDVKITADKNTNSLVVMASKQDYEQVLTLLGKIDIPRDQVYVEAIIMEMSVNDSTDWKVGYYQYGSSGYGKTGFNGGINLQDMLSPTGGSGAIIGFGQGKTITVTDPISKATQTIPSLTGFINFLKTNKRGNVLSTPQIMAIDNEDAEIKVGDKIATSLQKTSTATGDTTTANFEEAVIRLKIKPFISKTTNSIRMEIDQSVKQPGTAQGPAALSDNTIPLQTRDIKTQIVINNGDTAILGGLMKDNDTETISKVPLLGDLPIIGWLFKSRTVSRDKVNLVVFLTPKIIRAPGDANAIISKKLDERLEFVKGSGGRDPYGAKVEEIQRSMAGAGSPVEQPKIDLRAPPSSFTAPPTEIPPAPEAAPSGLDEALEMSTPPTGPEIPMTETPELQKAEAPPAEEPQFAPDSGEGADPALVE